MRNYLFYIADGRYSVPQFLVMDARDDSHALRLAREYLLRSPHYQAIDVADGTREVGRVAR